jgi:hypothetical protein
LQADWWEVSLDYYRPQGEECEEEAGLDFLEVSVSSILPSFHPSDRTI